VARIKNTISKNTYKTALYIRLSREDGDDKIESNSITNQRDMLQKYISENKEFELYDIYSDENYTGTNFNRPRFKELISDIENGLVNCVICKDLSRFGRDYIDTGYYLERFFQDYNVRFIAINDAIDSHKQAYDMLLPVKNVFNQQYAVDISKKVQSAFKIKQSKGSFIGAFAGYGYLKDEQNHNKLVIDEYAAQIVRRIFKMYLEGIGKIKIAKILNEEGVMCPSEYKANNGLNYTNGQKIGSTTYWTYPTIHRLLQNEMYIGNMVQNKTVRRMKGKARALPKEDWIIVENTHDAIIDKATWDKTQALLNKDTRQINFNQNVSVFAGFLKCNTCGRSLAKNKRGKNVYYICGSYKRYGSTICTPHTIMHEKLEEIVLDYLNFIIERTNQLQKLVLTQQEGITKTNGNIKIELEKIKIALNKIYTLKKGIYEDYREGILSKEEYLQYKIDYEKNEAMYKDKIKTLEDTESKKPNNILNNEWVKRFLATKKIDVLTREIMADFVKVINVDEDKQLEIVLNCSDEFNELLTSIGSADK
jgi:DNA invertase Pin-like site-specific DNA recombinase